MKFKELPEGYYFIRGVTDFVYVEKLENPEAWPSYITELEAVKVVHDGRTYKRGLEIVDEMEVEFKTYEEVRKIRKARGASISHVTRRLNKNQPLKGKSLNLALDLIGGSSTGDQFFDGIAVKLKAGMPLSEYELHYMVDVRLVHARVCV
ncbi:hypothetical protein [Bdellovibrio bacteriovorus]|uniref:hypothetical protein n=1 Tax=Bdellovibrio bacteriovorus TaxID=959 RepID=UPI0035A573C2